MSGCCKIEFGRCVSKGNLESAMLARGNERPLSVCLCDWSNPRTHCKEAASDKSGSTSEGVLQKSQLTQVDVVAVSVVVAYEASKSVKS
jgi:hypothetical protein